MHSAMTGDNSGGGTPVHIPNTAVKPSSAEDTCLAASWENRALPVFQERPRLISRSYFFVQNEQREFTPY